MSMVAPPETLLQPKNPLVRNHLVEAAEAKICTEPAAVMLTLVLRGAPLLASPDI